MKESQLKSLSNEKEIRFKLIQKYQSLFPKGFIREEFTGPGLTTRNDLFLVHDDVIISFEIKSNRDTLKRLRKQVIEYLTYSSKVIMVLDIKHLKKLEKDFQDLITNSNIECLIYKNEAFTTYSKGYFKEYPNLFNLLWVGELNLFKQRFKQRSKINKTEYDLKKMIRQVFTESQIHDISKTIFLDRVYNNRGSLNYKPTLLEETINIIDCDILELQNNFYNYIKGVLNG